MKYIVINGSILVFLLLTFLRVGEVDYLEDGCSS